MHFIQKISCLVVVLAYGTLAAQSTEKDILDIRQKYNETQQMLETLETKTIYELGWSAEGGEAVVYHKNNQVQKIRAFWFGEMSKGIYEYYYSNGKLIFAFHTDHRYNRPMYYDEEIAKENDDEPFDPSKTQILESRFYFKNRVLLRWSNENKEKVRKTDFGEKPKEILALSDELIERFNE